MPHLQTSVLTARHDTSAFRCGDDGLDLYLRRQASQDARRRAAVPYVMCDSSDITVIGFYTLSACAVELSSLPPDNAKRLPRYPQLPAVLIGRFAVDVNHQGHGLGRHLLHDAISRTVRASESMGIAMVVVQALNDGAAAFYQRNGFVADLDHPLRLYLMLRSIAHLFPR